MSENNWFRSVFALVFLAVFLCLVCDSARAQRSERERNSISREDRGLSCNDNWGGDRASHCLIKEQTIAATGGILTVDGRKNGGVTVKGWDRNEIFVRAKIQTWANIDAEAQALAGQVRINASGANIHAEGPETEDRRGWSVSFEVSAPHNSNLSLKAHNGGIGISDLRGQIEFNTMNGGVTLRRLAGDVKGQTMNGGLSIELIGSGWDGQGLDVRTTNGGVNLSIPENYSARLETSTVNGGLRTDYPLTVQGEIKRELSVNLGGGGQTIRAITTNGGVSIKRQL
jgi:Putative adhesin